MTDNEMIWLMMSCTITLLMFAITLDYMHIKLRIIHTKKPVKYGSFYICPKCDVARSPENMDGDMCVYCRKHEARVRDGK